MQFSSIVADRGLAWICTKGTSFVVEDLSGE